MTRFRWKMLAAAMAGGCAVQARLVSLRFSPTLTVSNDGLNIKAMLRPGRN